LLRLRAKHRFAESSKTTQPFVPAADLRSRLAPLVQASCGANRLHSLSWINDRGIYGDVRRRNCEYRISAVRDNGVPQSVLWADRSEGGLATCYFCDDCRSPVDLEMVACSLPTLGKHGGYVLD